jgi:hypothetical protein
MLLRWKRSELIECRPLSEELDPDWIITHQIKVVPTWLGKLFGVMPEQKEVSYVGRWMWRNAETGEVVGRDVEGELCDIRYQYQWSAALFRDLEETLEDK